MTGFGRGRYEGERFACAAEIRSVNHRFLDIHIRLPLELASFEIKVKKLVQSRIKRGRLDVTVTLEQNQVSDVSLNETLLRAYLGAMEKLRKEHGLTGEIDLIQLLRTPGMLNLEAMTIKEDALSVLEETIESATKAAMENLELMRVEEGQQLKADILGRLGSIQEKVTRISQLMQGTLEAYQDRLRTRLNRTIARFVPGLQSDCSGSCPLCRAERYHGGNDSSPQPHEPVCRDDREWGGGRENSGFSVARDES